jgi:DNA invertase Pin-like site-specific DNA recombinase
MLIGYARISKADDSQVLDLQIDALIEAGIDKNNIYTDKISGVKDKRPGLDNCLKALRKGDTLVVWKLDRLGRNLKHLITTIDDLNKREINFKVLTGEGINIDTTTPSGKMIFSIFGAFAEFERGLIRERTLAGLKAARARGRKGGRKFQLTKAQVRLAQAAMQNRDTSVGELCKELGITRPTLYRYVGPNGELREFGNRVLAK